MKLKKFKESDKKKIGIILFTIACILLVGGVVLYRTFAIFETNDEFDIINGVVQSKGDISFNFYINDVLVKEVPTKESGKIFDSYHSYCENGTNISWNAHSWEASIKNIKESPTKCHLKFIDGYEESILNGAVPDLGNGKLTPITIEENGIVKKADITNKEDPWYKYEEKKWANSVILKENSYELLKANDKIKNDPILEDNFLHLDGVDDYVDLGLANYDFQNQISLVAKVKIPKMNVGNQNFILCNIDGAGATIYYDLREIGFSIWIDGDQKYTDIKLEAPDLNEEFIVVATYDGNAMKIYINGEKIGETMKSGNIKKVSQPFLIGANPDITGPAALGDVDVYQAAIFNRAISEAEINEISNENFKITNSEKLLKYVDFTKKEYQPNEVIPEDNIESYFVWIPRYKYQLFSENPDSYSTIKQNLGNITDATKQTELNQQKEIQITFETNDVNPSKGNIKDSWLTHPAFTSFDNNNGFWMSKFESGYIGAKSAREAEINEKDSEKLIIKPNVYSWRNINASNAFYTSYEYQRELESHMMKNMEWGAVAYLTQSKYGRCTTGTCEEVRINNSIDFITGMSSKIIPTCGLVTECDITEKTNLEQDGQNIVHYNNVLSTESSTTKNYYGIYDMNGGAYEYVMGIMQGTSTNSSTPTSGRNSTYNSGFKGFYSNCIENGAINEENCNDNIENTTGESWPSSKYYDLYDYSTSDQDYQRGKLGDATKEMGYFYQANYNANTVRKSGAWYADDATFVSSARPWFIRGGPSEWGSLGGIFAFHETEGHSVLRGTFRVILTP